MAASAEKSICKMYDIPEVDTCNKARVMLFCIGWAQENLPPTSDAAKFHIMRSHCQASVWNQAHLQHPDLPPVTKNGMDALGRSADATAPLPATYPKGLQRDHHLWLYRKLPQPTLQLQENSRGMYRGVQLQETWRQLSERSR